MDMNNVSYEGNTLTYKNKDSSRTVWSAIYESYGSLLKLFRQAAEGGGKDMTWLIYMDRYPRRIKSLFGAAKKRWIQFMIMRISVKLH